MRRSILVPATPLLLDGTSGAAGGVLRSTIEAVKAAYQWILHEALGEKTSQSGVRNLAIVARGEDVSQWRPDTPSTLPGLGLPYRPPELQQETENESGSVDSGPPATAAEQRADTPSGAAMPLGLSVARELLASHLDELGHLDNSDCHDSVDVTYHSVGPRPNGDEIAALTTSLCDKHVIFVADGSTRLGEKPPGGMYDGAADYETRWHAHLHQGDWSALAQPNWSDSQQAGHLDIGVVAALAARAKHLDHSPAQITLQESPYGVGYCVAHLS